MAVPLVLASASAARRTMLERAGLTFDVSPSSVDEDILKEKFGRSNAADLALYLAEAKALDVSRQRPDAIVIGADQVLDVNGQVYDKPRDLKEAASHLKMMRGGHHTLVSAVVLARNQKLEWQHVDTATLNMRIFSDAFLKQYLNEEGDRVLSSVGAYRLEGLGIQLFERIEGCHETILGLPLLPLFQELRRMGVLET